jgi:hypothetical protein
MFEATAAAAITRRVPFVLVPAVLFAAILGLTPARAGAQEPPAGAPGLGPVVLDGELEVLYEDHEQGARLVHVLHSNNRRIAIAFAGGVAPDLMTGSRVRVRGNLANDGVTATSVEVIAASTSTTGAKRVLVILLNFSNNPTQPWPASTLSSVNEQVRNFYLENTYGLTSLSFTTAGWYTIAATDATCDYYTWSSQAEAAATKAGVTLSAYDRLVFAFPKASACNWIGMGNLGGPRSWINGTYTLKNVAHEQGHNFGNHHSKALKCASGSCSTVEYGDDRDVLGKTGVVGHMNAFQKERLGWLNYGTTPTIQTVTASGDYWIGSYVAQSAHPNALRIWNPAKSGYYYVESRTKIGFDANIAAGVTLHSGVSGISYQVDLDPVTTTYDSTLDVGQVFTDSAIGLSVETVSTSVDGALIRVNMGTAPCSSQAPGVSLAASGSMKYTVTLKNNNGSTCAASLFTAAAAIPSGWTASFSPAASVSLAPGASASLTLTLAAPAGTTGTYSFTVTGKDASSGKSGSATASLTLATSLEVTASATYLGGTANKRSASIVVRAKSGTQAIAGAAVTVVVTKPQGVKTTMTGTTAADGSVTLRFWLSRKDPRGIYQVAATASSNGATGQATTSFTVQ